jgi:hypothetical protein
MVRAEGSEIAVVAQLRAPTGAADRLVATLGSLVSADGRVIGFVCRRRAAMPGNRWGPNTNRPSSINRTILPRPKLPVGRRLG